MEKLYRVTISALLPHGEFIEESYHVLATWSWKAAKEAICSFNHNLMIDQDIVDYEIMDIRIREEEEEGIE